MLVQIVPIFMGFTLLGVMIFGAYFPRFGSFSWYKKQTTKTNWLACLY
jgi:hypothetical protein